MCVGHVSGGVLDRVWADMMGHGALWEGMSEKHSYVRNTVWACP